MSASMGCMTAIPIFILRGAFVVARFDNQGNAKAFTQWNGQQDLAPRFVFIDVMT
jgi:hypothetical protein